jgi:selenocysteine lyase/cysteine desulfurase
MTAATVIKPDTLREQFRDEMPVSRRWAYLDHAAVGPLPARAKTAIEHWLKGATEQGDTVWLDWSAAHEKLRACGSQLLHCNREEIAIIPNTSTGISVVAEGLRWQPGDSVVFFENEFPSNSLPWQNLERRGVDVRMVPVPDKTTLDLTALADAIDETTRLVSISWVGYSSGFRVDLGKVCEIVAQTKAQLFVDAIQGLGVFPIDVSDLPIDYLAADGHKWMLGPEGSGLLYIRNENLDQLDPVIIGWGSSRDAMSFMPGKIDLKQNASRYEIGAINMVGSHGFGASLEMLIEFGAADRAGPLASTVLENADELCEKLHSVGATTHRPSNRSNQTGIVPFAIEGQDYARLRDRMIDAGIALSVRGGFMRASVHGYNNEEDSQRLAEFIRDTPS